MIGYIYMTINKLDSMRYIGKHHATVFEPEKYLGSNKHLQAAIKKYGSHNFDCKLLQECFTDEELNLAEKAWISKYNAANSSLFYNIAEGGEGGRVMLNRIAINNGLVEKRILKDEPIPDGFILGGMKRKGGEKVSAAKKGKPSKSRGKRWFNNGIEQTMAYECPDGWTAGRLNNIPSNKEKELYNNGVEQKFFSEYEEIPNGWVKGAIPGTVISNTKGRIAYNNGINHIYLKEGDVPPEGFVPGYSAERKKINSISASRYSSGKRWYNNGIEQRYYTDTDTIPEGWVPGCCKTKKIILGPMYLSKELLHAKKESYI